MLKTGLLAGLWEFPSLPAETDTKQELYKDYALKSLESKLNIKCGAAWPVDEVGEVNYPYHKTDI